eukprot:scaffold1591_cov109-Isochrysis_galbana.AAC.1
MAMSPGCGGGGAWRGEGCAGVAALGVGRGCGMMASTGLAQSRRVSPSIDRKMKLMNSIASTTTGCGLFSHHVPTPNLEKVFVSANGRSVSHNHRKRTE